MNEYVLSNISQEPKLYTDVDIFFSFHEQKVGHQNSNMIIYSFTRYLKCNG